MEMMGTFGTTFKQELKVRKEEKKKEKERRKKERESRGSLLLRIADNASGIFFGFIYSMLYLLFVYSVVMFTTLYLPVILNYVMGYFNANEVLITSAQCALFFFTGWIFLISYFILRGVTRFYIARIKGLFPNRSDNK